MKINRNWSIWVIISIPIVIMIIDTLISNIGDLLPYFYQPENNIIFYILTTTAIFFQILMIFLITNLTKETFVYNSFFQTIKLVNMVFVLILVFLMIITIFEINLENRFSTYLLTSITTISYLQTIFNVGFLSIRFYKWFKENKTFSIIFYTLWAISLTLTFCFQLLINDYVLILDKPGTIVSGDINSWPEFTGIKEILSTLYSYLDIISFTLLWISTVTLLKRYSGQIGKLYYWIISSLPLIYYILYNLDSYDLLPISELSSELLFSINSTWGGILFAFVFLSVRKRINKKIKLRDYLLILSGGLILVFTANQATTMGTAFPPYGLLTVSFVGISSYFILVGTVSSVLTLSKEAILRKEIGKIVKEELKLFDEITLSELIKQTETNVLDIIKKKADLLERDSQLMNDTPKEELLKYIQEIAIEHKSKSRERS